MSFKLKITVTALIVSFSQLLNAQEISLVGGMNISNMSSKDNDINYAKEGDFKSRIGGHVGALVGFDLSEQISLQTGILFSTKGFKIKNEENEDGFSYKEKMILKLNYLEIPLLASYNYSVNDDFKVYAGVGPVLGIAIGGKYVYKWDGDYDGENNGELKYANKENDKLSFGNNEDRDDYKRLDLGLMVQAGVQYNQFKFGLFYNQGLMNISPYSDDGYKTKNRLFGLSAAYVIDLKK